MLFPRVCVENIYTNKEENLVKNVLVGISPLAVRSRKFQNILLVVSRICELDWDPQNLLFLHWFHHCRIKLLRFRGLLSFKKRSLRMTVLTEIEKLVKENVLKFHSLWAKLVGSSCLASEACHSIMYIFIFIYLQMTVLTEMREIKAGTFHVGQNPCWSENAICKRVYIRGLIGIAVNEAHCISHRQAAWNRVDW